MPFTQIKEYYDYVVSVIARNGLAQEARRVRFHPDVKYGKLKGFVSSGTDVISFVDGATLRFNEEIELEDRNIRRIAYSFHYEKPEYFFRYDKDPLRIRPFVHTECHLHVYEEEPRYITHETSFEEIFLFIIHHFYRKN